MSARWLVFIVLRIPYYLQTYPVVPEPKYSVVQILQPKLSVRRSPYLQATNNRTAYTLTGRISVTMNNHYLCK